MPRFLSMIRINEQEMLAAEFSPEFGERMGALIEEITKAGVMLDTAGLTPTSVGTRLTWSGGNLTSIDGPFTETKEVGGLRGSLQKLGELAKVGEALERTKRFLEIHPADWTITAKVRQIAEA